MKIAIVGIGGVGGYYGGLLAKHYSEDKDVEIIFIARGDHLEQIKKNGLRLITAKGTFSVRPDLATDTPSPLGVLDVVVFCVKAYDLEDSATLLSPCIDKNTTVISLLNGVDNAGKLNTFLDKGIILNGCVYIGAHIVRPGVVQQTGILSKLFFGDESNKTIHGKGMENFFKKAGIDAEFRKDINNIVWEKYVLISALATATTFLNKTMRGVLDCEEGKALLEDLLTEVIHVAKAKQISLPENIKEDIIEKISKFPRGTKTSMQMDFEKESKTELETFTGYVVKEAGKLGLAVPAYEKTYAVLQIGRMK